MINKEKRQKTITFVSLSGIAINLALATAKAIIGVASSSISVVNDAVNNATDSLSAIVTMCFYSIGKKRPTRKHPLGYGRMEYLSALLVSILVIATGIQCLGSSIKAIQHPHTLSFSTASYIIIVLSIIAKIFLSKINIKKGKEINSETLVATGKDALSDVLVTSTTLIGAILSKVTTLPVDGIAGAIVSAFILYSGIESVLNTTSSIMGERPDDDTVKQIREIIKNHPPLKGGYDIILHVYGPERALGTCNVETPIDTHAEDIFDAMTDAAKEIQEKTGIYFTFGLFAVNDNREDVQKMKKDVLDTLKRSNPHILSIHAFHVHFDKNLVHFDVVVDFSVKNTAECKNSIYSELKKRFPEFEFEFTVDPEYD